MDHGLRGQPSGRSHDCPSERNRRLADRGEFDLVAAGSLDRASDAGRHPEREVRRIHDCVDLEVADVTVPELDPSHRSSSALSVRIPTSPAAAWYTRGSRRDIEVTTSQELVVRACASSRTSIRSPPWAPISTKSSSESTAEPGTSV